PAPRPRLEVEPERLGDAPAPGVAERVVAEEPEMPGAAARRHAGADVADEPASRARGEGMEVREARGLELALARLRARQAAEPVQRAGDQLGGGPDGGGGARHQ